MKELIGIAVMVATLFGGTITSEKIFVEVRQTTLAKVVQGLPRLSTFSKTLTHIEKRKRK